MKCYGGTCLKCIPEMHGSLTSLCKIVFNHRATVWKRPESCWVPQPDLVSTLKYAPCVNLVGKRRVDPTIHLFIETGRDVAPRTFINIGILQKWNVSKMGVIWHCGVLRETDTEAFPPGSAFLCLHTDSVASEVWAQLQYYEKWQGCVGRGRRHLDNCEDVDIWTLTRSQCSPLCGEHHNHRRIQTFCNCFFFSYFFFLVKM